MVDNLKIFAIQISELIVKKENEMAMTINWKNRLESYGFLDIYEEYSEIDNHQSFNNPEYVSCVQEIFFECIDKDLESSEGLLNSFLNTYDISEFEFNESFTNKFSFINENMSDKLNNCVFISHASKDDVDFKIIEESLKNIRFAWFIAEEDIELSEEWEYKILNQLNESSIIIPILSENFKKSNYCNLEVGIALQRNMLIIPLSIGDVDSYGFFKRFQSKNINDFSQIEIQKAIIRRFPMQTIDYFLENLNDLSDWSYDLCNLHLKLMEPYFSKFTQKQINQFVSAVIHNNQLWGFHGKSFLKNFYRLNKNKIPVEDLNEFKKHL